MFPFYFAEWLCLFLVLRQTIEHVLLSLAVLLLTNFVFSVVLLFGLTHNQNAHVPTHKHTIKKKKRAKRKGKKKKRSNTTSSIEIDIVDRSPCWLSLSMSMSIVHCAFSIFPLVSSIYTTKRKYYFYCYSFDSEIRYPMMEKEASCIVCTVQCALLRFFFFNVISSSIKFTSLWLNETLCWNGSFCIQFSFFFLSPHYK